MARNSALDNRNITAALKNVKIKKSTECTGFLEKTTKKLDKIVIEEILK